MRYGADCAGLPERIGGYAVERELGAGGMGTVYLARSRGGRAVAVKVARPEIAADPHFRERFRAEVAAARSVGGFHTAPVVDADPAAEAPWLATAYVPGRGRSRPGSRRRHPYRAPRTGHRAASRARGRPHRPRPAPPYGTSPSAPTPRPAVRAVPSSGPWRVRGRPWPRRPPACPRWSCRPHRRPGGVGPRTSAPAASAPAARRASAARPGAGRGRPPKRSTARRRALTRVARTPCHARPPGPGGATPSHPRAESRRRRGRPASRQDHADRRGRTSRSRGPAAPRHPAGIG
ncbi:hypothetical protein SAMN02787144_100921 [Streptomyces atratus]|uniref:Protein kinase domain-containing protein n=1 Tax=Streptomyces atratus TaxID=1893 RepID=A0A1K2BMC6_STRAR|nr:hypothetical protein SAMN02787144_100921 [Streptomyces atratus]